MKSIYILLTHSNTCISRLIKFATADMYTHASISFDESLQPLYSFARKYVYVPLPAGLRIEPLINGFYKKDRYIPCALYVLRADEDVYETAKKEVEEMFKNAGAYRFNIIGLLLCRLGISYSRKYSYFCSEFVSEILKRSKALHFPKEPSLMRPNDYTKISQIECCYEGNLSSLIEEMA